MMAHPWLVMTRILRHLQLASVPPPIAPARCRQKICAFHEAHANLGPEATCVPRRLISSLCALQSRVKSFLPPLAQIGGPKPRAPGNPSDACHICSLPQDGNQPGIAGFHGEVARMILPIACQHVGSGAAYRVRRPSLSASCSWRLN
jgi:hypothetical protein